MFVAFRHANTFARGHGQCPQPIDNGVVQCLPCKGPWSAVEMYGWSKTIARFPCTPPLTLKTFGEKLACSGKEIAGLKKKKNMMTRKS